MRTAIMNLKGGTGKTVTAINVAAILARDYAQRVLLVDADSQANLTEFVTEEKTYLSGALLSQLLTGKSVDAIQTTIKGVSLLAADSSLMALDVTAAGTGKADRMALRYLLDDWGGRFDWVIIDCPPAFSASAMAALIAADQVIIPMKIDAFGYRGMGNMLEQIRNMRRTNRDLNVAGVLPTMVYPSPELRKQAEDIRNGLEAVGLHVFPQIRRSTKLDDMTFAERPLIYSAPRGKATYDYKVFVKELFWAAEGGEQ